MRSAPSAISRVVSSPVAGVEMIGDGEDAHLLPEERGALGEVSANRALEFARGRTCARRALAELGEPLVPILRGPRRQPLWPSGIVGSITHCRGYAAATAASASDVVAIGIDAQPHAPLRDRVLMRISSDEERAALAALGREVHGDCLLFSAKESVFKAWYPLANVGLGFRDALVTFAPDDHAFHAELLVPGPLSALDGRWTVVGGIAVTAVVVPRAPRH